MRYARWDSGEVDFVWLSPQTQKPIRAFEIKWSDKHVDQTERLAGLTRFAEAHPAIEQPLLATTRTKATMTYSRGFVVEFVPTALYCYTVGKNLFENRPHHAPMRAPWIGR